MPLWVHYEERGGGKAWYGPFDDDEAELEAGGLSQTYDDASDRFAEVISGERGQMGTRLYEYYNGQRYSPGGSPWHGSSADILIPESVKNSG